MFESIPRHGGRASLRCVHVLGLILFTSHFVMAQPAQESSANNPYRINFERTSDQLVLSSDQSFAFRDDDQRPAMLRVYGDGMVLVHFPKYMKRAGDYRVQLSQSELLELLGVFIELDYFDFDADQVKMRQSRADQATRQKAIQAGNQIQVSERSDDALTTIMVNVAGFHAEGKEPQGPIRRQARWYALQHDAKKYPDLQALSNLADVEQILLELCADEGLERYQP